MRGARIWERIIERVPALVDVARRGMAPGDRIRVEGTTGPVESLVTAWLKQLDPAPLLLVAPTAERARTLWQDCAAFLNAGEPAEQRGARFFPDREIWPHDDPWIHGERLSTLTALLRGEPLLVVASLRGALRFTLPPEILREHLHSFRPGESHRWDELLATFAHLGYLRTRLVELPGTFSVRGGIIDLFPGGFDLPVRLEWLGDELESIRHFDPESQRTMGTPGGSPGDGLVIQPVREYTWDRDRVERVWETLSAVPMEPELREHLGGVWELFKNGVLPGEFEYVYPLYYPEGITLLDYFPDRFILVEDDPQRWEEEWEKLPRELAELFQPFVDRNELPALQMVPYRDPAAWRRDSSRAFQVEFSPVFQDPIPSIIRLDVVPPPAFVRRFPEFLSTAASARAEGKEVLIWSGQSSRLAHLLQDRGIPAAVFRPDATLPEGDLPILLIPISLSEGFHLPSSNVIAWSDREIVGKVVIPAPRPIRFRGKPVTLEDLEPGDIVVHTSYGIARFEGLVSLALDGQAEEFLQLTFAGDDKLYVPVHEMERVQKYVSGSESPPPLSKLGSKEWSNKKKKAARAVEEVAKDLIRVAAVREAHPGHAFAPDTPWQRELEDAFPFRETPDQARAIREVKEDMERARPMDRLILGDAGYGKTEVALRAAFKAVMDGKQVAILVPTTILAQQHHQTFTERLSTFPARVEILSRFRSPKEQKSVLADLALGKVDIVIGTHRLLQKDVSFANLGLLVVDEEQRFGVRHKERLKQFRETVDILTLTATPIPRTLHMALAGVRNLSLIETPPHDRLPVKTFVAPADPPLIKQAIRRELDRGGQVYFLHNRVETIGRAARQVAELAPEARIAVAHGQMPSAELESIMALFTEGLYDILVCTTIIENGLDILNVNTLIANDAHRLGLAQLYQVRGRIGRSHTQAYAYFLTPPKRNLSDEARRRLETIRDFTNFGSGYQIAMRDLEIRGTGNLLGTEQSGEIGAVGFHLYCQMLASTVRTLREGRPASQASPVEIRLPVQAFIPDTYIDDKLLKMTAYRRLARVTEVGELALIREELRDRFGEPPSEVEHLIDLVRLKILAGERRLSTISSAPRLTYWGAPAGPPRVTVGWEGSRRLVAALPPLEEVSAAEGYLAFTPRAGDPLLSTVIAAVEALEPAGNVAPV